MVKDLDDRRFTDRTGLEVLHPILLGHVDGLHFGNGGTRTACFLALNCAGQVDLVSHQDLDGDFAPLALCYPLLHALKARPLDYVEHVDDGGGSIDVLMDVFVMALLAGHVEVDNFVLIGVVDVVSGLDVQLGAFLVLDNSAEGLRDGIEEGCLPYARVTDYGDLESEVVVVNLSSLIQSDVGCLLLLNESCLVRRLCQVCLGGRAQCITDNTVRDELLLLR